MSGAGNGMKLPINKPDIVGVAERLTNLRRSGKRLVGRCPMPDHEDRTPSFFVNPDKQSYRCFGCGAHGDVIDLVMKVEGLTFKEALQHLNIETPARGRYRGSRKRALLEELKAIELEILYHEFLRRHSCLCSMWLRFYNRSIASKYDFWWDDEELVLEHLPELLKQCADMKEVERVLWWVEKAKELRRHLAILHEGGTAEEKFKLFQEITGGIDE